MYRRLLLLLLLSAFIRFSEAQTVDVQLYRTITGHFNNPEHESWGAAGTNLLRVTSNGYADSISAMAGATRPNPRTISNTIFGQDDLINDPLNLSDFCWVWGQFLDHDIGQTTDGGEPAMIQVPAGDPDFDPLGQGMAIIPMMRNVYDPASGQTTQHPRQHPNLITAFIDGSGVYGSSEARAAWLRTFSGGKLKVSSGNLLPFNTLDGEFDGELDPEAPEMDNATHISEKLFVAGDSRANENPLLASFHTLFVRQHNALCEQLAAEHPAWDDEVLYQHARKLVSGLIQSIVYDEWLPAMGIQIPEYSGYQPAVNPGLYNVFTGAAFRMGHTLLNGTIQRLDNDGEELPVGNMSLREAFFNPYAILQTGGVDPFFKGMAVQIQQSFDAKMVNDVRNFLFGPPGAGGLDLAAININRGRERGLPDFNTIRENFGLNRYHFFQQINPDAAVFTRLLGLYTQIDDIDPWVGMLAETPMPGALFGETVLTILQHQFTALRDGDRFFYLNDPVLSEAEKNWIQQTTLHHLIMKNTNIVLMQDEVFRAMPHSEICNNMTAEVSGTVHTETGERVGEVALSLQLVNEAQAGLTDAEGRYLFDLLPACEVEYLTLSKADEADNGVTTVDLVIIQKHILGVELLDSPYKVIAADVNRSHSVSTLDLINLRRVILGIDQQFPNNTSWRFIPTNYEWQSGAYPLAEDFVDQFDFGGIISNRDGTDFVAVKIGDVNHTVQLSGAADEIVETRGTPLVLTIADRELRAGQTYVVALKVKQALDIHGFQFGLQYQNDRLEMLAVEVGEMAAMQPENIAHLADEGLVTTSWNDHSPLEVGQTVYRLHLKAKRAGRLREGITLHSEVTRSIAFSTDLQELPVVLQAGQPDAADDLAVLQNRPNPFRETTEIPFFLPEAQEVVLRVFDLTGKLVYQRSASGLAGSQTWILDRNELPTASGLLHYQVATSEESVTYKMMVLD